MKVNSLINMALMQVLWFGAVIGASKDLFWLAPLLLLLFAGWEFSANNRASGDFKLMLVAVLIGLVLDTTWIKLGWLEFASSWPATDKAPVWILSLWAGLALTLNHSLAWLQSRLFLAGLLGGLSSPFSYLGAAKMGALTIVPETWPWIFGLSASWAIALPLLLWLARQLNELGAIEKDEHEYV